LEFEVWSFAARIYDPFVIHRSVVLTVALAALVAAASVVAVEVRQEREFRRLIAVGDAALAPLAAGEYVLELSLTKDGKTAAVNYGFRLVP
jgi:hypothetical protein